MSIDFRKAPRLSFSFFSGAPQAPSDVPAGFMVALNGHAYNVYEGQEGLFAHETLPHQRPTNFTDANLGERALNPDAVWRVTQESWVKGSGQRYLDSSDSDAKRYWQSKGIDPWTANQFTLLHGTTLARATAATALPLVSCGNYLYVADGNEAYWTTDGSSFTAAGIQAGEATPAAAVALATDGNTVWAAIGGSHGVHKTTRGATTSTHANDLAAVTVLNWVKGRLMGAVGPSLYIIPSTTTAPSALFTHPNTDWVWTSIGAGDNAVYAVGWSGDYSAIYRFTVLSDGSGLGPGILAGELPRGEIGYSVRSYLGFVIVGTSQGVRTCQQSSSGDIQIGALIPTGGTRCSIGYDRFVFYGWDNYDSVSAGLGRLDLSVFPANAPAYASDLMAAAATGQTLSVANWQGKRAFSVLGSGVYIEAATPVTTGFMDTGRINYQVTDPKNILGVQTRQQSPLSGTHQLWLSVDDDTFTSLGTVAQNGSVLGLEKRGEVLEVRHTLTSVASAAPVVRRYTVLAIPAPSSAIKITVPLILDSKIVKDNGQAVPYSVNDEKDFLEGLRRSRQLFIYQEGERTFQVTMVDFKEVPEQYLPDRSGYSAIFIATLIALDL